MLDSKKYLHPEAAARIARLELRARHVVEGFLAGIHRSPYFGQSMEFRQHREYTPGDDFRHVDWKVWAKQDRFYVKQFEEDTNARCTLLVDASASMSYGSGPLNKYDYACTLAASLATLLLKQKDAVGCMVFDDRVRQVLPQTTRRRHLNDIVGAFGVAGPREKTDLWGVLRRAAETYPRRGIMVLASDLLVPRQGLFRGLRQLQEQGHDVIVFHVLDDDELTFPFSGPTRFEGLESGDQLTCNPRALRQGYLDALGEYLAEVRRGCASRKVDYRLIRTSEPLDAPLAAYLSHRMGLLVKQ